jgi:hypothetical protein
MNPLVQEVEPRVQEETPHIYVWYNTDFDQFESPYVQKTIHIRNYDMNSRKTNKGGITIVSRLYKKDHIPHTLAYGVSFASPKDCFNKKKGASIATARLNNKDPEFSGMMKFTSSRYNTDLVLLSVIGDILRNVKYPKHAEFLLYDKVVVL